MKLHKTLTVMGSALGALALLALPVLAQDAAPAAPAPALDTGNTAWMLTSTALVLMMTLPGLALFYGGLVRAKNILNVLMQCMLSAGIVGVLWVLVGYSLAFGTGNSWIGDLSKLGLSAGEQGHRRVLAVLTYLDS